VDGEGRWQGAALKAFADPPPTLACSSTDRHTVHVVVRSRLYEASLEPFEQG
jgi:hypothetical protein